MKNKILTELKNRVNIIALLLVVIFSFSCEKEEKYTGNLNVTISFSQFDLYDGQGNRTVENLEFGIFPTDFNDNYAWEYDAIQVSTIKSQSCKFENILMGTYKIAFLKYPNKSKIIQILPNKTVKVEM